MKACIHYPINLHLAIIHQLNGVCTTTNADMLYLFLARRNAQFLAISLSTYSTHDVIITTSNVWCWSNGVFRCFVLPLCVRVLSRPPPPLSPASVLGLVEYGAATWHHIACNLGRMRMTTWYIYEEQISFCACTRSFPSQFHVPPSYIIALMHVFWAHKTHIFVIICINTAWERKKKKKLAQRTERRRHENTEWSGQRKKIERNAHASLCDRALLCNP